MLSIIIAGRNDNYGGDFEHRVLSTSEHNAKKLNEAGILHEIVFVEWNPLPGNPLLSKEFTRRVSTARSVVVDRRICDYLRTNPSMKVDEYCAKNVGVRHSEGDWILITNPDNFLGADTIKFLKSKRFRDDMLYRAGLVNIESQRDVDNFSLEELYTDSWPYDHGSGDFLFCHRDVFYKIGGFREDMPFTPFHKDSIFVLSAIDAHIGIAKVGTTFHLDHSREGQGTSRTPFKFWLVNRKPQEEFGLTNLTRIESQSPTITNLGLNKRFLLKQPWPRQAKVPLYLRYDQPKWFQQLERARQIFYGARPETPKLSRTA